MDHLFGGVGNDHLFGRRGGNDRVVGGTGEDYIYGDANVMYNLSTGGDDHIYGGNDSLYGGAGADVIFGDARGADRNAACGNDVLNGGTGPDTLYGDTSEEHGRTGRDRFVFDRACGRDVIEDFEPGRDRIDLSAFHLSGFNAIMSHSHEAGGSVLISLSSSEQIRVAGVRLSELTGNDFIL